MRRPYFCQGLLVTAVLALASAQALAVGLGALEVRSFLNESLDARVRLMARAGDQVEAACIGLVPPPGIDPRDAGMPYLTDGSVTLSGSGAARVLEIKSRQRLVEPILGLVLKVDCPGTGAVLREYTVLLDPRLPPSLRPAFAGGAARADSGPATAAEAQVRPLRAMPPTVGGGTWPVRRGETLSRIAARLAPGDRRRQGRLIEAIVAANPRVFPDGDPDKLPAGARLQIPEMAAAAVVTAQGAAPAGASAPPALPPSAGGATPARGGPPASSAGKEGVPGRDAAYRLTLTTRDQVPATRDVTEAARMVAESRRLLVETEAQYADAEALKARMARLERQIARLEKVLRDVDRVAAATAATLTGSAPATASTAASSMPGAPAVTAERQPPPTPVAIRTAVAPLADQIEAIPPRYWWAAGVVLTLGLLLLLWRRRRAGETDEGVEDEFSLAAALATPGTVTLASSGGVLTASEADLAHKDVAFTEDPLAGLPDEPDAAEPATGASPSEGEVPVLDHQLTAQMDQELFLDDPDFDDATRTPGRLVEVNNLLVRAEFHLLLRQVGNAVHLLCEAIDNGALREEPALWLMLLRIHRQERDREAFEALQAAFHERFNILVPGWGEEEPESGDATSLESHYPRILHRIVALWDSPRCEQFINGLLLDNRDGNRRGFDLPVAEELMLLKGVLGVRSTD